MTRKRTLRDKIGCRLTAEESKKLQEAEKALGRALSTPELKEMFGNVNRDGQFKRSNHGG